MVITGPLFFPKNTYEKLDLIKRQTESFGGLGRHLLLECLQLRDLLLLEAHGTRYSSWLCVLLDVVGGLEIDWS